MKWKLSLMGAAVLVLAGCSSTTPMAPIEDRSEVQVPAATTVPVEEGTSKTVPTTPYLTETTVARDSGRTHVVTTGDTLYNIGVRYGVNPRELQTLNGISDPTQMALGTVLKIPETTPREQEAAPAAPVQGGAPQAVTGETIALPSSEARPDDAVTVEVAKRPDTPEEAAQKELAAQAKLRSAAAQGALSLQWPADGSVIADFAATNHQGIDIAGQMGDPVKAVLKGTVHFVGNGVAKGYGNFVIVRHDVRLPGSGTTPLVTVYGNLSEIAVKMGESVREGQVIGKMGNSDSDRVKLRFEMRQGAPVNPQKYLKTR